MYNQKSYKDEIKKPHVVDIYKEILWTRTMCLYSY